MTMVFTWNDQERKLLPHVERHVSAPLVTTAKQNAKKSKWADLIHPVMFPTTISISAIAYNAFYKSQAVWNQVAIATSTASESWAKGGTPFTDALWPLVRMLQDFALPVGVGVAVYGMIEHMLDNPNGRKRVSAALFGYGGVFLIPLLFRAVQHAFGSIGRI